MFQVAISPVDLSQPVRLPDPWPALEAGGFHDDLLVRARGFLLQAERLGFEAPAREFLRRAGEGFQTPFRASEVRISPNDPDRVLKERSLAALQSLADEFGDRVSSIVWRTFAFLATRPNPTRHTTILASKEHLPHPWWVADTVLHATGKVYGFMLNLHSRMSAATGMVFEHNCDCSCDIHAGDDYAVHAPLPSERRRVATAALFSHLLGESLLIMALKMPFEMGLSPEAAEVMALPV
jgi:hypothetical protein